MPTERSKYWFKRRRYGWGWVPVSWKGWLALALYLAIIIFGIPALIDAPAESSAWEGAIYFIVVFLVTVSLIRLGYAKGPKPRWRWGRSDQDNPSEDF
ncbi:MAG TPA: hypothetical protein VF996_01725 [Candidatus Saccharimonadales bacterium]|jgi:hypothetical protein